MREKDLIEKSKQGDVTAFNTLVLLHQERVFRHCLSIVKDEEAAKDLVQETFLQAFSHLSTFRSQSSFYTWSYRIAHNLSLNYLKKKKRAKEEEYHDELFSNQKVQVIENEGFREQLLEACALLSEKLRVVYELCEIRGLPQKQVAVQLDIPEGTVRSRLHSARKKMRDYFSNSSHNFRKES